MALSLELSGILWWNFAYSLILTPCTPWDCQMTLEIGWVFAAVQILKKVRQLQNDIYHRSRLCRAPNSESENGLIYWTTVHSAMTLHSLNMGPLSCEDSILKWLLPKGKSSIESKDLSAACESFNSGNEINRKLKKQVFTFKRTQFQEVPVVSTLSRFGPGSFRPESFRPWVVSAKFGGSFRPDLF